MRTSRLLFAVFLPLIVLLVHAQHEQDARTQDTLFASRCSSPTARAEEGWSQNGEDFGCDGDRGRDDPEESARRRHRRQKLWGRQANGKQEDTSWEKPRTSGHRCIGVDAESEGVSNGMCLFRDVCMLNATFIYLTDSTDEAVGVAPSIMPRLHARARRVERDPGVEVPMMELDIATFHEHLGGTPWTLESRVHVYIERWHTLNGGHVIGDEVWPIFQGMYHFGLVDYDSQVIVEDNEEYLNYAFNPSDQFNSVYLTVSKHPVRGRMSYDDHVVCFRHLIAGFGFYGYGSGTAQYLKDRSPTWGRAGIMRAWRLSAFSNLNLPQRLPLPHAVEEDRYDLQVTIVLKHHSAAHPSFIVNHAQLADALREEYAGSSVEVVCWFSMPFVEQLALLARSHVMLSLPGSDIMNAPFLNDGALLVAPCRKAHPGMNSELAGGDGFQPRCEEAALWLRHLPALTTVEYCTHRPDAVHSPAPHVHLYHLDPLDVQRYIDRWLFDLDPALYQPRSGGGER